MGIRTGDINFVIDYALSQAASSDPNHVYALIDTTTIGVMGHSLGGSAALGIGRTRHDVGAVIALESPFLCDIVGVNNGEFVWNEETYPTPVLNIYSDSSWGHLENGRSMLSTQGCLWIQSRPLTACMCKEQGTLL